MARGDFRIDIKGVKVPFTCENSRFKTNIGHPQSYTHGQRGAAKGSVLPEPLITHDEYTLWLEHVWAINDEYECYWLMWYDPEGKPTISGSGVFTKEGLQEMLKQLGKFVP